jgi:hypothetical protein
MKKCIVATLFLFISIHPLHGMFSHIFGREKLKKQCIQEARKHMPEDLKACKTIDDIETLLRKKEKESWLKGHINGEIEDEQFKDFVKDIADFRNYVQSVYLKTPRPDVDHSFKQHDPIMYDHICTVFKEMEIHPESIDIIQADSDEVDFSMRVVGPSITRTPEGSILVSECPIVFVSCLDRDSYAKKLKSIEKHEFNYFTPYHESIHILNIHYTVVGYFVSSDTSIIQEGDAELLPLLKTKDIDLVLTQMQRSFDAYADHIKNKRIIKWNRGMENNDRIHPDQCTQLLPYYLKIHDILIKNNAQKHTEDQKRVDT